MNFPCETKGSPFIDTHEHISPNTYEILKEKKRRIYYLITAHNNDIFYRLNGFKREH